jgi:ketopantoate reductase
MKIGILGTGGVGAAIGSKLVDLGHQVMMGSRTANNEKAFIGACSYGNLQVIKWLLQIKPNLDIFENYQEYKDDEHRPSRRVLELFASPLR